jgi:hypothetical protein
MQISEKQLAANRANALKSKGPKTAEGKRNSATNSTRHGILANAVVLKGESRDRFFALLNSLNAEFNPQTPSERVFVEKMAVAHWRLLRLWAVETAGIEREVARQTGETLDENAPARAGLAMQSIADKSRHLDLMSRYEHRFDRQHYRALEGLRLLREEREVRESRHDTEVPDESEAETAADPAGAPRSHQPTENKALDETADPISTPSEPVK